MDMLFIKGKYKSKYCSLCMLKDFVVFVGVVIRKNNGLSK